MVIEVAGGVGPLIYSQYRPMLTLQARTDDRKLLPCQKLGKRTAQRLR